MRDHLAMLVAWQAAVDAIRNPPKGHRGEGSQELLRNVELIIRCRASTTMPEGPENALALLRLWVEFADFVGGDMTDDQKALMDYASSLALAVLARARAVG